MRRVAIIGGGISGLSAAYYLSRLGAASTLIERQRRLGGVIQTERVRGCLVENGPDSFLAQKPWALELIRQLGLESEVVGSNDHLRVTYVLRCGRLVALPDGLMLVAPTRIAPVLTSGLLSWRSKLRLTLELLRKPPASQPPDQSVADFLAEHYGQEAVDYIAEPLLAGVYGGDVKRLSAASVLPQFLALERTYGSLTRGMLALRRKGLRRSGPLFQTLRDGLGRLVEALAAATRATVELLGGEAEAIERRGEGYAVRLQGQWLEAKQVVLACPAWEAARLLEGVDREVSELLASVPYTSSITVSLGYRVEALNRPLKGFGFLVPQRERRALAACTWVGNKFPHRVPAGMALLRCFLLNEALLEQDDASLVALVREDLTRIVGLKAAPEFARVARWPRSMAQYTVGHRERLDRLRARLRNLPGLHPVGNAYEGVGVPDCVRLGREAAQAIAAALE